MRPGPGGGGRGPARGRGAGPVVYAKAVVTWLIWGFTPVTTEVALREVGPWTLNAARWTLGLPVLWGLLWLRRRSGRGGALELRLSPAEWLSAVAAGVFGVFLFNAWMFMALQYSTAVNNSLIYGCTPVLSLLLASAWLREPVGPRQWVGVLLSVAGVAWIVGGGSPRALARLRFDPGDLYSLAASAAFAVYATAARVLTPRLGSVETVVLTGAIGLAGLLPAAWLEARGWPLAGAGWLTWLAVLYQALGSTVVAFVLWVEVIEHLGAARAAPFNNLYPIFGTAFSVALLGEPLRVVQAVGGVLILLGIWLVVRPGRNAPALGEWRSPAPAETAAGGAGAGCSPGPGGRVT